jgi:hypothetical protein
LVPSIRTANLQVNTVAAAFSDAQFAVLMLGTNDAKQGVGTSTFITNLTSIVNVLEGQRIVVILSTIPPNAAYNNTVIMYNSAIRSYAQSAGLPLIDFYSEILDRAPGTTWENTLISSDGTHPSASGGGYNSASNPYTPDGNPATLTTGDAALNVGYLLRSWLTIQKLGEVEQNIVNASTPAVVGGTGNNVAFRNVTSSCQIVDGEGSIAGNLNAPTKNGRKAIDELKTDSDEKTALLAAYEQLTDALMSRLPKKGLP